MQINTFSPFFSTNPTRVKTKLCVLNSLRKSCLFSCHKRFQVSPVRRSYFCYFQTRAYCFWWAMDNEFSTSRNKEIRWSWFVCISFSCLHRAASRRLQPIFSGCSSVISSIWSFGVRMPFRVKGQFFRQEGYPGQEDSDVAEISKTG